MIPRCLPVSGDFILLFYMLSLTRLYLSSGVWSSCQRPIYAWLIISHVVLIMLRVPQHARRLAGTPDSRTPGAPISAPSSVVEAVSRVVLAFVWFVVLPFHCIWAVVGTWWLSDVLRNYSNTMPTGMGGVGFVLFWQAVGYAWIAVYVGSLVVAVQLRHRLQQATSDLRAIVDDDVQQRWGQSEPGSQPLLGLSGLATLAYSTTGGLTPSAILGLPAAKAVELTSLGADAECSICLCKLEAEDEARQLPCKHAFHRACIDLWLLRQDACPLCKSSTTKCPADDVCPECPDII